MEELRYNGPECCPERYELADYRSTEETHSRQPTTQSNPLGNHSEDFIPTGEKKWNDIPANDNCKKYTLESSISKLVMMLVRRLYTKKDEKLTVQFIGNRWVRSYDMRFRKEEGMLFLIRIGSIIFGKEAI